MSSPAQSVPQERTELFEKPSSLLEKIINENRVSAARQLPVMDIEMAMERNKLLQQFVKGFMKEGDDYGKIPGTGEDAKPTLFKSGAEKLNSFFGYVPVYETTERITDWLGEKYGEPLFYWDKVCTLMKDGTPVGQGNGSCSSWEKKYRYRAAGRTCPSCGNNTTLIKGKAEYERNEEYKQRGSWVCYEKKGGCGQKYFGDDPEIMNQPVGQIANPDIADVVNTVQKMADKRAYVASTLTATGASQYFSQDLEDVELPEGATAQPRQGKGQQRKDAARPLFNQRGSSPVEPTINPDDPQELKDTMRRFYTADKFGRLKMGGELKQAMQTQLNDDDRMYRSVLDHHKVKKFDEFKVDTDGIHKQAACLRDLWLTLAKVFEEGNA